MGDDPGFNALPYSCLHVTFFCGAGVCDPVKVVGGVNSCDCDVFIGRTKVSLAYELFCDRCVLEGIGVSLVVLACALDGAQDTD